MWLLYMWIQTEGCVPNAITVSMVLSDPSFRLKWRRGLSHVCQKKKLFSLQSEWNSLEHILQVEDWKCRPNQAKLSAWKTNHQHQLDMFFFCFFKWHRVTHSVSHNTHCETNEIHSVPQTPLCNASTLIVLGRTEKWEEKDELFKDFFYQIKT